MSVFNAGDEVSFNWVNQEDETKYMRGEGVVLGEDDVDTDAHRGTVSLAWLIGLVPIRINLDTVEDTTDYEGENEGYGLFHDEELTRI